ncbi:MAG: 3-hydroxyacyl-CoA dehydrogenase/enoyl-CoA hydratase family protein [Candidatus Thalassarchaeaceae archaeon]|nr:3-hydroxyacyl-CoA dehydrogenase/enoyl-CoA hydratase family protein [Candidatus Thalassarchaeaceae archaeon]
MTENGIERVAVIGSGVMGAGIAAHCANAGCDVLLLDIVPDGASDRNTLAAGAIKKMFKSNPEMLMHKSYAKRITAGNIDDDLPLLKDYDWVVEVIIENLEIKQSLYQKLAEHIGSKTILSSNTSTLPRSALIEGMDSDLASRFLITHFFNPPRYLPLLEVVSGADVNESVVSQFSEFALVQLGKRVTHCNDTPGFIGNRLGVYFVQRSIKATLEHGLTVEQADAMLGRPIGLPKTAVFGLMDLVGIDLIPHVMSSMLTHLQSDDPFHQIAGAGDQIVRDMLADGYTGRKGKGGFYRLNREGGAKIKEARNLVTGEYATANRKAAFASAKMAKQGITRMLDHDDEGSAFVAEVLLDTLSYAAYLVPEVTDDIYAIDGAMKVGYNWKKGPFEMIDSIGAAGVVKRLQALGRSVPEFLQTGADKGSFYSIEDGEIHRLSPSGEMVQVSRPPETLTVADLKRRGKPIQRNASASIWDAGDEVLLVEYHSKMNAMDPLSMEILLTAVDMAEYGDWKGILIANDSNNFCAGANLGLALFGANLAAWKDVEDFIALGQEAYQALKYAEVPVVAASTGVCVGGGAEVLLHCDAVQAHSESYVGLVEVGVGIVPGWGGCKEMLARLSAFGIAPNGPMGAVMKAFEMIGTAQIAKSAEQARRMGFLRPDDRVSMNRDLLLADAKVRVLELADDYTPPEPHTYHLPGATGRAALDMAVSDLSRSGQATPHDVIVTGELANILTGGDTDMLDELSEDDILAMELAAISKLSRNVATLARMEHMVQTGKPLRN